MLRLHLMFVATLVVAPWARADIVFVKGQPPVTGVQVTNENAVFVEYTKGGKKTKVDAHLVTGITYDKQNRAFRLGVELFSTGDFVNAVKEFQTAADEPNQETAWVKEHAPYFLGRALMATGQFDKAAEAFRRTLAAKRDSRLLGAVSIGLIHALTAAGNFSGAQEAAAALKKAVVELKAPGFWSEEADLAAGEALVAEKSYDKASSLLQELAARIQPQDDAKEPEKAALYVRAKRLQGLALTEAKDLIRARSIFSELATRGKSGNIVAAAAARNGLSELSILEGKDLDQALMMLAQAKVENFAAVSEMPRTCYLLGLAHQKLVGTLDGAKDLSKAYLAETIRRYPESREAVQARELMKQM